MPCAPPRKLCWPWRRARRAPPEPGHGRNHRCVPRSPRSDQQHSRPGDPRDRHPRYRPCPARSRAGRHPQCHRCDCRAAASCRVHVECLERRPARPVHPRSSSQAIQAACGELGLESLPMISRAYHDSLFMAGIAPTGMIFIPCRDGISHRPEEYSDARSDRPRGRGAGARTQAAREINEDSVLTPGSGALKCSGDRAVGFVGGEEDFVGIFQAERLKIDENAMLVGHDERDTVDLEGTPRVPPPPWRRASAARTGSCARRRSRAGLANFRCARFQSAGTAGIEPVGLEDRGQDPIGGVGQRRVAIAEEAAEGRIGRFQQEQLVDARLDAQAAAPAPNRGRSRFVPSGRKKREDGRGRRLESARAAARRCAPSPCSTWR